MGKQKKRKKAPGRRAGSADRSRSLQEALECRELERGMQSAKTYYNWALRLLIAQLSGGALGTLALWKLVQVLDGDLLKIRELLGKGWTSFLIVLLVFSAFGRYKLMVLTLRLKERLLLEPGFAKRFVILQFVISSPMYVIPVVLAVYYSGLARSITDAIRQSTVLDQLFAYVSENALSACTAVLIWVLSALVGNLAYDVCKALYFRLRTRGRRVRRGGK